MPGSRRVRVPYTQYNHGLFAVMPSPSFWPGDSRHIGITLALVVTVKPDTPLVAGQHEVPVLWTVRTTVRPDPALYTDEALAPFLPPGRGIALRAFGHDGDSVHWLLTRAGTPLHTDPRYARYSHQLVLRNDGGRVGGLPRYDGEGFWHPPMEPGVMYCLDTHSPHQGKPDERMEVRRPVLKLVAAVDSDVCVLPADVWPLLLRFVGRPLPAALDPDYSAAPRQVWNP